MDKEEVYEQRIIDLDEISVEKVYCNGKFSFIRFLSREFDDQERTIYEDLGMLRDGEEEILIDFLKIK